jgi:sRNA-binding protein
MIQKDLSPGGRGPEARKIASAESRCDLPKTPDVASPTKKKRPDATVGAVIALLAERWPATFAVHEFRRKPLKVGIFGDVVAAIDGAVTRAELGKALGCYTANPIYMSKLRAGVARIGLDGQPAGEVTTEQADYAKILRSVAVAKIHGWRL